jgi:hypothetical protein
MARYGQYNYSDKQLERINARRRESGRDELVNTKGMGGYSGRNDERANARFDSYAKSVGMGGNSNQGSPQGKTDQKTQRGPAFPSERPSALDQYKGQKSLSERMSERGSMKSEIQDINRAMQVGRAVESENEKRKRKGGKGISTPSLQSSFNRFTA